MIRKGRVSDIYIQSMLEFPIIVWTKKYSIDQFLHHHSSSAQVYRSSQIDNIPVYYVEIQINFINTRWLQSASVMTYIMVMQVIFEEPHMIYINYFQNQNIIEIIDIFANFNINLHFIPSNTPNFGGLSEEEWRQ